ncbi:MAG: hypothetical protein QNJ13_06715 [Paracoccaceae bacterium]|nr:hypothetical protein [Paracoccaceae bacterium]
MRDDDTHRKLDRLVARERRRNALLALAIAAPALVVIVVLVGPFERAAAPETATVIASALRHSDNMPRRALTVELAGGGLGTLTMAPNLAPPIGAEICVVRIRHIVFRGTRLQRASPGACDTR